VGEPRRRGPLATNDVGYFDGSGRLVIVGRSDEVIISGGENVHPATVEAALRRLPGVHQAMAVGISDGEWGQRVVAVVVADHHDECELLEALRSELPRYAVPKEVRFVASLPLLANGKIDRMAVQRLAGQ
jgi:acyl-CoA synthetase (AMP-forming)/AMP-acid ligase II